MVNGPEIVTFLTFAQGALNAAEFYVSIFPDSRILSVVRSPVQSSVPAGEVLVCDFELSGRRFTALNGGQHFQFSDAISLAVPCGDQAEIDYYWSRLLADGGSEGRCGWLKDRFGVSWQVVPKQIQRLITTPAGMQAMMKMTKFDIAALEAANQA